MKKQNLWITTGYEICSIHGLDGLKVEQLARVVGVSKSSFYHHFADLECFTKILFDYHFECCGILASKEKSCIQIYPDLINILLEHKTDLLFHRQLRIDRKNSQVEKALVKANSILGNYSMMLWAKDINHNLSQNQLDGLFKIATDDFYMRINENNLNYEYLSSYFKELGKATKQLVSQLYATD
ncbi:TetR/AcrR family transcriptional regulator [Tunicatimonas pelagia]|uniref:TetR/AcrR family transcriptional regulator n=1 Tax=Tunicatimonas pelagia TaxID=931531 RepID=UPI0026658B0C|nr:TetR/AcrR family transcriptional regulator [Tunicatimonas pelagia]WKN40905.1 TetR/AcrR family transcriptional regulator [Tunicatimonas pelagia]